MLFLPAAGKRDCTTANMVTGLGSGYYFSSNAYDGEQYAPLNFNLEKFRVIDHFPSLQHMSVRLASVVSELTVFCTCLLRDVLAYVMVIKPIRCFSIVLRHQVELRLSGFLVLIAGLRYLLTRVLLGVLFV